MKKFMLFIMMFIAIVAGGVGLGLYLVEENIVTASSEPLDVKGLDKRTYQIEEITTNLKNGTFKTSFTFVAYSEETALEVANRDFQIRNFLIKTLSSQSVGVLSSQEKLKELEQSLKLYINENLQTGEVAEVFINDKLISL